MVQIRNQFHPGPQPGSWTPKVAERFPVQLDRGERISAMRRSGFIATYDACALEARIDAACAAAGLGRKDFCTRIGQHQTHFKYKLREGRLRVKTIDKIERLLAELERQA